VVVVLLETGALGTAAVLDGEATGKPKVLMKPPWPLGVGGGGPPEEGTPLPEGRDMLSNCGGSRRGVRKVEELDVKRRI